MEQWGGGINEGVNEKQSFNRPPALKHFQGRGSPAGWGQGCVSWHEADIVREVRQEALRPFIGELEVLKCGLSSFSMD